MSKPPLIAVSMMANVLECIFEFVVRIETFHRASTGLYANTAINANTMNDGKLETPASMTQVQVRKNVSTEKIRR